MPSLIIMGSFFNNSWVISILAFLIVRISLGYIFDLRPVCRDGWRSHSIGSSGACSHRGVDNSAGNYAIFFSLLVSAISGIYWNIRNNEDTKDLEHKPIIFLNEDNTNAPSCPTHGKMIAIINEKGEECWACKNYPKCKYWSLRSNKK